MPDNDSIYIALVESQWRRAIQARNLAPQASSENDDDPWADGNTDSAPSLRAESPALSLYVSDPPHDDNARDRLIARESMMQRSWSVQHRLHYLASSFDPTSLSPGASAGYFARTILMMEYRFSKYSRGARSV